MRKFLLATVAISLVSFSALAAEKPAEIASTIKAESPMGEAGLDKLVFHVYDASLWTDASTWSMRQPFALSLKYGMRFDSDDFVDRTLEEMEKSSSASEAQREAYKPLLGKVFPAVKKGDHITALYTPGKGTSFFHNGKPTGSISNAAQPQFAEHFFAIWLSPKSSEPDLRNKLLGK